MIKLSLQPADFDMFKKFLIAWHFTNNINIHGSVIQQQIAKSAWVYCDLTSILPQKVDMAVLVDKFNVKELKKITAKNNNVLIKEEEKQYFFTNGQITVPLWKRSSPKHDILPDTKGLTTLGTPTLLQGDDLKKFFVMLEADETARLYFNANDELYLTKNDKGTAFNHTSTASQSTEEQLEQDSAYVLRSSHLSKSAGTELSIATFKQKNDVNPLYGKYLYLGKFEMEIASNLNLTVYELLRPVIKNNW